ncbi:Aste57867_1886 [Aphanomyces stellatus]|uniref:Aste57867_1886 protein n=1 Tax=Aphanomyces stellatus TaxID=120398 RepID=A0A485K6D2_9STRA|nr:hypothetical protein As57867_001884 [Aphanomyces stellatus]VFT79093.1 Aste57867_1886 [Aphanomyces stellatus]
MSTKKRRGSSKTPSASGAKKSDGHIRIDYDSMAYPALYGQFEAALKRDFPSVDCAGGKYPLPASKQRWVYIIYAIQFFFAIFLMVGEETIKKYEIPVDEYWLEKLRENRYMLIPGVMMLSPIRTMLSNTGAFEVYLNDELIHSTIEKGKTMTVGELKMFLVGKGYEPTSTK